MKKRWMFIPAFAVFIIALILGSFFDLQISQSIANTENIFGLILASVGENPAYGLLGFIAGCFFGLSATTFKKWWQRFLLIGLGVGAILGASYFQGTAFTGVNAWGSLAPELDKLYFSMPIGLALVVPFTIGGWFVAKKNLDASSIRVLAVILVLILFVLIGINIIKIMAYRPRFRLIQTQGEDLFKNWWEFTFGHGLKGVYESEHIKSFPSGHTGSGCFAMVAVFLPYFFPKLREYKYMEEVLFFGGLAYAMLIAFSRILVGAHFLSDTAFSGIFFLVSIYIANEVLRALENKAKEKVAE